MKKMNRFFFFVCCSFSMYSCTSLPEPDNKNHTLVIGTAILEARGYQQYGSTSVNGVTKQGIEITLRNISSSEIYTIKTMSNGLFYSTDIPEGSYRLTKLFLKKESGSSWASVTWQPPTINIAYRIEIVNNKVNNIGTIYWESDPYTRIPLQYNKEYEHVQDLFQKKHKSSNWNEKEWLITEIHQR